MRGVIERLRCAVHRERVSGELNRRAVLLRWAGWFWFLTASMAVLLGVKYPLAAGFPVGTEGMLFFGALSLAHWYSLAWLITLLIFYPLIALLPSARVVGYLGLVMAISVLLLLVVDAMTFSLYRFHLNGAVFNLVFSDAATEIFVFDAQVYLIALAIVLVTLVLVRLAGCLAWRLATRERLPGLGVKLGVGLFAIFLGQSLWFAWADATGNVAITSQARLYPGYMPVRAETYFRDLGLVDGSAQGKRVSLGGSGSVNYPKSPLSCEVDGMRPPVFLIVVDSWRYDTLDERATPNLHRFAAEALRFERHYSGGNNTRTGIFSLFYGLPATYWETFLDERVSAALIDQLLVQHYELAIYASAKLTGPEFDRTVFASVENLRDHTEANSVYGRDLRATEEFVAHLQGYDGNQPLFGFLFYDAPHSNGVADEFQDYFAPAARGINYWDLDNETEVEPIRNLYLNSVRSVDELVGQAFAAIRAAGLWEQSIIIVTGDHGQELNDNGLGFWGHNGNFTDAQLHVPLLVKWPGREPGAVSHPTTHYDIPTTLLGEALGCSNPASDYSVGYSLFDDRERFGFVVGGFGDFGFRLAEQIYWIDKFGTVQVMSADNRSLPQEPEPGIVMQVIEETSEFFR